MYKAVTILYLVCMCVYVLFTRNPDYFDGEIINGTIHLKKDSTQQIIPFAQYSIGKKEYSINADYWGRTFQEGNSIKLIYEVAHPASAVVYNWWGYWITIQEISLTASIYFILFLAAVLINKNPTDNSPIEESELPGYRKKKYNS